MKQVFLQHAESTPPQEKEAGISSRAHITTMGDTTVAYVLSIPQVHGEIELAYIEETIIGTLRSLLGDENMDKSQPEAIFQEVNAVMNAYRKKKKPGTMGSIHAVLAILEQNRCTISATGNARCLLIRRGKVTELTQDLYTEDQTDLFAHTSQGSLTSRDTLVLTATPISGSELEHIYESLPPLPSAGETLEAIEKRISTTLLVATIKEKSATTRPGEKEKSAEAFSGKTSSKMTLRPVTDIATSLKVSLERLWADPMKRKGVITVGLIVVLVLFIFYLFSLASSRDQQKLSRYQDALNQAQLYFEQSKKPDFLQENNVSAKDLLRQSKTLALQLQDKGLFLTEVDGLLKEIKTEEDTIDKITTIDNPTPLLSLSQKGSTDMYRHFVFAETQVFATNMHAVLGPLILNESSPLPDELTLPTPDTSVQDITYLKDQDSVILYTNPPRIVELKKGEITPIDTIEGTWKAGLKITTFAGKPFLYILSPQDQQIWQYERKRTKYMDAKPRLSRDQEYLKDAISFTIDGNIYVLTRSGEIIVYYQGKRRTVDILSSPATPMANLKDNAMIVTSEIMKHVYILDPDRSRILLYKKDTVIPERIGSLTYDRQIVVPNLTISSISVNNDETTITLLANNQFYKISL